MRSIILEFRSIKLLYKNILWASPVTSRTYPCPQTPLRIIKFKFNTKLFMI